MENFLAILFINRARSLNCLGVVLGELWSKLDLIGRPIDHFESKNPDRPPVPPTGSFLEYPYLVTIESYREIDRDGFVRIVTLVVAELRAGGCEVVVSADFPELDPGLNWAT
ncbi:hypothetical protein GC173_00650 [bacterium]|nr:hypothetical protein [bacterium]